MKKAILIHGWTGRPNKEWRPWLKRELQSRGWKVTVPAMPNPDFPKQEEWVASLQKVAKPENAELFLIGHSLGVAAILRFLEKLPEDKKVGGAILVAGFTMPVDGFKEIENFFQKPFNFKKIKNSCKKFVAIHSDNDPWVDISFGKIFERKLGAKLIIVPGARHFSGDDGFTKLPIVLESLLKISK